MSYGKEVFYTRPDYCEMIVDIFETAMASPNLGEGDRVSACNLIEAFLLNLRGHVDDVSATHSLCTIPKASLETSSHHSSLDEPDGSHPQNPFSSTSEPQRPG